MFTVMKTGKMDRFMDELEVSWALKIDTMFFYRREFNSMLKIKKDMRQVNRFLVALSIFINISIWNMLDRDIFFIYVSAIYDHNPDNT